MPVYDYECQKCKKQNRDVYQPATTTPPPLHCEKPMERLVSQGARSGWGADLWRFWPRGSL